MESDKINNIAINVAFCISLIIELIIVSEIIRSVPVTATKVISMFMLHMAVPCGIAYYLLHRKLFHGLIKNKYFHFVLFPLSVLLSAIGNDGYILYVKREVMHRATTWLNALNHMHSMLNHTGNIFFYGFCLVGPLLTLSIFYMGYKLYSGDRISGPVVHDEAPKIDYATLNRKRETEADTD